LLHCFSPDFKKGSISTIARQHPNITATIAHLMGIKMDEVEGEVMWELFGKTRY
jgi:hypothetical protein